MARWNLTPQQRFWEKVDSSGGPDACWLWVQYVAPNGYGRFYFQGRPQLAHRVAWQLTHGTIPTGDHRGSGCVLHRCDVRACVNPAHLVLGTQADNIADMDAKNRRVNSDNRGVLNGRAKLTDADIIEIRADPRIHRLVAVAHGVSPQLISRIRLRQCWIPREQNTDADALT